MGLSLDEFDGVLDGVVDANDRARLLLFFFDQNGAVNTSTVTDRRLIEEIQYHVIEPPNAAFFQSGYWTRDEVLGYLNRRQRQFLKDTGLGVKRTLVSLPAETHRAALPIDWIATRRAMLTRLAGIVSSWPLDEVSGTRFDAIGDNDLADNNTVTQAAGKVGNSAQFTAINGEYLSIASNPTLETGDIDFMYATLVYPDSHGPASRVIAGKTTPSANPGEWILAILAGGKIDFAIFAAGVTLGEVISDAAIPDGAWAYLLVWHDSVNDTVNLQINGGAVKSAPTTGAPIVTSLAFQIGRAVGGVVGNDWDGRMDEALWGKLVPSAALRAWLYNNGVGRTLQLTADPGAYRELPKSSGWAADQGLPSWPLTRVTPQVYMDAETEHLEFQVAPASSVIEVVELLYVYLSTLLTGENVLLAVPDEFAPAIKYGTMSDMLSKIGRGQDLVRAGYCELRYQEGVEAARLLWP